MKLTNEQAQAINKLIEQDAALSESLETVTDAKSAADILENALHVAGIAVDKSALVNWLKSLLSVSEKLSDDELDTVSAAYSTRICPNTKKRSPNGKSRC